MQVVPTASTSSAFVAPSIQPVASSSTSRRSSRSPSSTSSTSTHSLSHLKPSPSPLRRLAAEQQASTSFSSSSPYSSLHAKALPPHPVAHSSATIAQTLAHVAGPQSAKLQRQKQAALDSQMKALYEAEYREEVLEYMYEMESSTTANVELIDMQPELAWYMRPYLIDFLIEIHSQYRLRPEALFLAINIVDRYVSKRIVYKKHYQLVGCAALWIASKFEDAKDRVPTVEDLCAVCCSAYDQSAFIQMEGHVLSTIGWLLGHPTAEAWLRVACCQAADQPMEDTRTQHVARFIMEITLFHRAFVPIKPSDIAQACLLLARFISSPDSQSVQKDTERTEAVKIAQLLDIHLAEHLEQVSATVVKKYSPSFYSRSSVFVREWYLSGRRFTFGPSPSPMRRSAVHTADVDMSPSSSSSTYGGRDSDYDERDDEEDYSTGLSSEPLTPTTSVCSSACSSDPFEVPTIHTKSMHRPMHSKTLSNSTLCVPVPGRVTITHKEALDVAQQAEEMQWQ